MSEAAHSKKGTGTLADLRFSEFLFPTGSQSPFFNRRLGASSATDWNSLCIALEGVGSNSFLLSIQVSHKGSQGWLVSINPYVA